MLGHYTTGLQQIHLTLKILFYNLNHLHQLKERHLLLNQLKFSFAKASINLLSEIGAKCTLIIWKKGKKTSGSLLRYYERVFLRRLFRFNN